LGEGLVLGEAVKESVEVGFGVAPIERDGGLLIAALEGEQPLGDFGEIEEVVGVRTLRWTMESRSRSGSTRRRGPAGGPGAG
jgi:hypothetical protein